MGTALSRPQPAADLQAVELRQHDVEDHEIDRVLLEALQRLLAVARLHDLEALVLEGVREELLDRLLVVDEQDRGAFRHEQRIGTSRTALDWRGRYGRSS